MPVQKNANAEASHIRQIALIHNTALGDFVLSLHLMAAVGRAYPGAALGCITRSGHGRLAELTGLFRGHWDIEAGGFHSLFTTDQPIEERWRTVLAGFDLVVNLTGSADSVFAGRLADCCEAAVYSVDPVHREDWSDHITGQWAGDLRSAGLGLDEVDPFRAALGSADRFKARATLQRQSPTAGEPIVLIHPGSGGQAKRWPLEHFENVVMQLKAESVQPLWMVGPAERDRWPPEILAGLSGSAPVVATDDVRAAAELTAAADAFVGNDSGMSHVAALMGTATIAVFGPTPAAVWRPLGERVRVLAGGGNQADPFAGIEAGAVCDAVLSALAEPPISA